MPNKPQTSQGEGGRPIGEPESFSDYSMIYDRMKLKKRKNTEYSKRKVSHIGEAIIFKPEPSEKIKILRSASHCSLNQY